MATPHISAEKGDFAKTVLMPGDPLRAKFIADTFLKDVRQVTGVRGMLGFTGTYEGRPISVMGSGMGMPSIGIYSYELYKFYDVDNIIRIGSAGSYTDKAKLFDVVLAAGAVSEMESFALFANAQVLGKNAACLLTISDSFVSPEITTAEQRQTSFTNMMKVALGAEY